MTSEARIKELAAILANQPLLALAVDEINRLEEEAAEAKLLREKNKRLEKELDICQRNLTTLFGAWNELRERVGELEGVLRAAQLDLDFVDGLFASDDVALIENTPSGIWRLDMSNINQKIEAALSQANAKAKLEEDR